MTPTRRRDVLVLLLTAAAGATNVLSLTGLGGVPASIMTANLVVVGLSITRHQGPLGGHAGAALAGFVVAVFLTSRLLGAGAGNGPDSPGNSPEALDSPEALGSSEPRGAAWPRPVAVATAAEALPLAGVAVGWGLAGGHPAGAGQLALCATAAFAMGMQSAAVRALGVAGLSSTFFTGTLTDTASDLAGPGRPRWTRGASGLAALIAGAAAEGAAVTYGQPRLAPLLPLALVGCVAALGLSGFRCLPGSGGRRPRGGLRGFSREG
jgi:uncharacterized membrane protein YoaK (UPF0700 family)